MTTSGTAKLTRLMAALVVLVTTVLVSAGSAAAPTPAVSPPPDKLEFYKDLARAIGSAQGRILFTFGGGIWRSHLGASDIYWNVADGTVATTTFDYQLGALRSAEVTFRPEVHVSYQSPQGVSGALSSITYDSDGDILKWDFKPDNAKAANPGGIIYLKRHLEFARTPEATFRGLPFKGSSDTARCDASGKSCVKQPMLQRVRVFSKGENQPGLHVAMKDNSTLHLSRSTAGHGADNFVVVNSPSEFEFDNVDYDVIAETLEGELVKFHATLGAGHIAATTIDLRLTTGARLDLGNLQFSRRPNAVLSIEANGEIKGSLGAGSHIIFATAADPQGRYTELALASGTASLIGTHLHVSPAGDVGFDCDSGSTLELALAPSRLAFGNGSLALSQGTLTFIASRAKWSTSADPIVAGKLDLNATVSGGRATFGYGTSLKVVSGKVSATGLNVSTLGTPLITGKIADADLLLDAGSTIGVRSGLTLETDVGSSVRANNPDFPLEFIAGDSFPIGVLAADIRFKTLRNATLGWFALNDGRANLALRRRPMDVISGNLDATGTLMFDIEGQTRTLPLQLANGTFYESPGRSPSFDGYVSTTVPAGTSLDFRTPYERVGNTKERHFSILFRIGLVHDVQLKNVPVSFNGQSVKLAFNAKPTLRVTLPTGCGAVDDYDQPERGCKPINDQHDDVKGTQEAFTDEYLPFPLTCRYHLNLKPASYDVPAEVSATANDNTHGFDLSVKALQVPDVGWVDDGCAMEKVVGDVLSALARWTHAPVKDELKHGVSAFVDYLIRQLLIDRSTRSWHVK